MEINRGLLRLLKAPLRYGVARAVPLPLLRMATLLGALLHQLRARAGRALLAAHAGWAAGASEVTRTRTITRTRTRARTRTRTLTRTLFRILTLTRARPTSARASACCSTWRCG